MLKVLLLIALLSVTQIEAYTCQYGRCNIPIDSKAIDEAMYQINYLLNLRGGRLKWRAVQLNGGKTGTYMGSTYYEVRIVIVNWRNNHKICTVKILPMKEMVGREQYRIIEPPTCHKFN